MAEEEDRISLLPDCLLLEIISRLELSTKEAIKTTTTISKRWQHLWTRLPTLVFTDYYSFIDKTLTQCPTDVNLKKFKFQIEENSFEALRHLSKLNSWIRYAITRNVQEVEIRISESYDIFSYDDELFFNNSCIMSMKLSHCVFNPPNGAISWDKLKCLCIDHGKFDERSIGIARSPCLETLELNNCYLSACFLKSLFGNFRVERLSCDFKTYESFSCDLFRANDLETCEGFSYDLFDDDDSETYGGCSYDLFDDDEFLSVKLFMSIKFSRCEFNPPDGAIRALCIENSTLDEHAIGKILFRNPCLEALELNGCCGVRRIDITSNSVKNLALLCYGDRDRGESCIDTLQINAPYILSLNITGEMYLEKFLLENVSSLVKADFNFNYLGSRHFSRYGGLNPGREDIEDDLLRGLLSSLGHVNDITLGDYNCLQAATRLRDKDFQFFRDGADGEEDRITELIASGWKKVVDNPNKRNKKQCLLKRRQEKVEETEESDDEMGFCLFD